MYQFLCFSINNWEQRKARKQQFMLHLSEREDVERVIYAEPALNFFRLLLFPLAELKAPENRKRWIRALTFKFEPVSAKLLIFTPVFFLPFAFRSQFIYNLNLFILHLVIKSKFINSDFKNTILWLYNPLDYKLLKYYRERGLSIFDWAEDWVEYYKEYSVNKREEIKQLEEKIIQESDLVFVVSQHLLKRALVLNENSHQLLDGARTKLFFNYNGGTPHELKNITKPIVAYVGAISWRLDLDLILKLAEEIRPVSILLIGNVLLRKAELAKVYAKKNVYLLGVKNYEELPGYLLNSDVLILPYVPAEVKSPTTKMYDYLSCGLPIVTTNLPELEPFLDCIKTASDQPAFINAVKDALKENSPELMRQRRAIAAGNSWDKRAEEIISYIANTRSKQ